MSVESRGTSMTEAMDRAAIHKNPSGYTVPANLPDYDRACAEFRWDEAAAALDGLPDGRGLNITHEAVDRHADGPRGSHTALRWLGKDGTIVDLTYDELRRETNRFANVLRGLDVGKGDTVFALAGRLPMLYVAALGTLKHTSVFCPLFAAFGPEPIFQRMSRGRARLLVTTERLYTKNVAPLLKRLPELEHVLLIDSEEDVDDRVRSLSRLLQEASPKYTIPPTDPDDAALLHFTSGTTGLPKGALHVHRAVLMHHLTGSYVLDFHPTDVFWCTADPGWVTGTSYGIIAPLAHGITNVVDEGDFDAERWYGILESQGVNVWYTAPTAIRMLMRLGGTPRRDHDLSSLRHVCSVGEPLNPEAVVWGQEALGLPIHDNWWQTETGGIMIANYRAMDIRPGSMGRPLPGIEAAILRRVEDDDVSEAGTGASTRSSVDASISSSLAESSGSRSNGSAAENHDADKVSGGAAIDDRSVIILDAGVEGELALRKGWPSMFRAYIQDEERYRKCFAGDWYLTGDLARRDADGYYWFVGRSDDIIKTAGHMVSPFEVESTLMEHEVVAEAAVIGKPDPIIGAIVKAFVALKPGVTADEALRRELIGFGRSRLGSAVAPKEIEFQDSLPKTKSGKIMRRLLKARELGLPEGDLSTLETIST